MIGSGNNPNVLRRRRKVSICQSRILANNSKGTFQIRCLLYHSPMEHSYTTIYYPWPPRSFQYHDSPSVVTNIAKLPNPLPPIRPSQQTRRIPLSVAPTTILYFLTQHQHIPAHAPTCPTHPSHLSNLDTSSNCKRHTGGDPQPGPRNILDPRPVPAR